MKAMNRLKTGLGTLALLSLLSGLWGCGSDLYADCQLDKNSRDQYVQACATDGDVSCAVENYIQCDTRVCARYEGSTPYCTTTCADDADCVNGTCRELVLQSGRKYCVQSQ